MGGRERRYRIATGNSTIVTTSACSCCVGRSVGICPPQGINDAVQKRNRQADFKSTLIISAVKLSSMINFVIIILIFLITLESTSAILSLIARLNHGLLVVLDLVPQFMPVWLVGETLSESNEIILLVC